MIGGPAMKTINIKGKGYVPVNERIIYFNNNFKNGTIETEIIKQADGQVIMKSTITPDHATPDRVFTAMAHEKEGSSFINKTSYIENCETSAVGRALGMMGIGIDTSIGSADEVANAINNQTGRSPEQQKADYYNKERTLEL